MNIAIIGYGNMGHEVEKIALQRSHIVVERFDINSTLPPAGSDFYKSKNISCFIDFSHASAVAHNTETASRLKIPLIEGTTGWHEKKEEILGIVKKNNGTIVYGNNFSVGAQMFFRIVQKAAQLMNAFPDYDVAIHETHHTQKKDGQCGTIQLDMSQPERFDLYYIDKDNEKHRPIMIHRTVFGSIERFLGILIEHFAGKFPLWMAPVQAVILPINDDLVPYAEEVKEILKVAGLRVEVDSRTESLNKKVREAQLQYIPLILTIGGKEKEAGTLSVRTLDGNVNYGVTHQSFLDKVLPHIRNRELSLNIFDS